MMADTQLMIMAPVILVAGAAVLMIAQAFARQREARLRPVRIRTRRVTSR